MTVLPETGSDGLARAAALQRLQLASVAPASIVEFESRGRCLVIGEDADALAFVRALADRLECVVLVPADVVPDVDRIEGRFVVRGGRPLVRGALGDFEVVLVAAGATQKLGALLMPAIDRFDLVVDLQATPLLRHAMLPLGYYAPAGDETAREALLEVLPQMRGQFEKPKYFNYNPEICAHGRSGKRGCTRCIDVCPAEAIVSIGEAVVVNPYLCQGGGGCAMVCPSGAMTYAYPRPGDLLAGLRQLLRDYRDAGGVTPSILFHDEASGAALEAGLGEAMPAHVLPVALEEIGSAGMDVWLGCLAYGAEAVVLLTCDRTPPQIIAALHEQVATARALLGGMGYREDRLRIVNGDQPVSTLQAISSLPEGEARQPATFAALGGDKRGSLRLALVHLQDHAPDSKRITPLERGAPFGDVRVDAAACTLCMSCVSSCPTHALQDGRGLPQLNFREWNCIQCGLCERTCPEDAITLQARFLHDAEARERPRTLHEEQPVCCVACGKPFATRKMLDKLTRKLEGHWMFQAPEARRRLEMCEDCRVRDLFTVEARRAR
jgi:Fe-S-cluster-containing hydrogenase component 2